MIISRRVFLSGSASLIVTSALSANAVAAGSEKTNLVVVMLRGGMDGLAAVPFVGDNVLSNARPDIGIDNPSSITGDFALHPRLENFKSLWSKGKASIFHATSIPYTGRSHFEGQYLMESGGVTPYLDKTGWLGRALEGGGKKSLSISLPMPLILRGGSDLDNFMPSRNRLPNDDILDLLANDYSQDDMLSNTLATIRKRPISMMNMRKGLGDQDVWGLAKIAAKQLADPGGPSIAVFDIGGFDTHSRQGGDHGEHAEQLKQFDNVIGSLYENLGDAFSNTIIVSLTEFGRTIEQNGGSGTEHGYGTAILMAGGLLPESRIIGDWPGLKKKDLFEGRDLNATIDARAVYASITARVLGTEHKKVVKDAFFGADLPDMTKRIFG
jgi:uncharacterized protein (DUF1501 family)